jgi:hypothetical protein
VREEGRMGNGSLKRPALNVKTNNSKTKKEENIIIVK